MQIKNPAYSSWLVVLQFLFFGLALLYFGRTLFITLSFGLLIALILYPPCNWLEKKKWSRSAAIALLLAAMLILFAAVMALLLWQLQHLKDDLPVLLDKLQNSIKQLQQWLAQNAGIIINHETNWLKSDSAGSGNNTGTIIKSIVSGAGSFFFSLFLIPVFTALFLYHREQFVNVLKAMLPEKNHEKLMLVIHEATFAYSNYIIGLIKVYIIVGILNSAGLLMLGIENAILFGMITAIMTMVPYVGIIISSLLPITVAWVTKDSIMYPLGVVAIFTVVQYLENSVIFPKVVGQQLNVSTWAILVALLAGGLLWGVAGMVLFMPFVAILKIISGHIEEWKPLHLLLSRAPVRKKQRTDAKDLQHL